MNPTVVIFLLIAVSLVGMSYYITSLGKQDPCAGTESSFKAWCNLCSIRNWPSSDGASNTMIVCMQKLYNKTISTCKLARDVCTELAGVS